MSTIWEDKKGRKWDVDLDIPACNRIDASDFSELYPKEFSIYELERDVIAAIYRKPPLLFAIIWAIVRPQAISKFKENPASFPIDPEKDEEGAQAEFVSAINSKAKQSGFDAFMEALSDFFPELKTGLSTLSQQTGILREKLNNKLGTLTPVLEEMIDSELDQAVEEFKKNLKAPAVPTGGT